MNKRGFTLVELLAAIVILGVIVTIVYPTVISTINSSKKKAHDSQIKIIEKAMKMYYMDHANELKDLNENGTMGDCEKQPSAEWTFATNESINIESFITKLIDEGYISDNETENGKILDPCTGQPINGEISVKWLCKMHQYEYEFKSSCD